MCSPYHYPFKDKSAIGSAGERAAANTDAALGTAARPIYLYLQGMALMSRLFIEEA